MDGYIKYFDDGGKNITFVTDDEKMYEKYNEIWEVIRNLLKIDFTVDPVRDNIYLKQCKYKLKKRKIVNYIDDEIIDEDSDSYIDDAVDSHLNFSVPDSYVKI